MNAPFAATADKAAALRLAFDRAFAEPVHVEDRSARIAFLAIHVGTEAFAVRLSEISGLHADKKITPVPGGAPALLGIAGFRGSILPVYSLRILLGIAVPHAGDPPPRWLLIAAASPLAFAFDSFDGQRRVQGETIAPRAADGNANALTQGFVRSRKMSSPILHLPSIIAAVQAKSLVAAR